MYELNLRQVSYALSEALDLVGIDDLYHGKRVAFMSSVLSQELGHSQERVDYIISAGMLHDCGVSNTDIHKSLITELDWKDSQYHCIRGALLLKSVTLYKKYSDTIFYHHTHWSDLELLKIDENIKIDANIILLTDRVDALRARGKSRAEIIVILEEQKSKMFHPKLIDIFKKISSPDAFWFYLDDTNIEFFLQKWIGKERKKSYSFKDLKEIAFMFSNIVDAKSYFTSEHSLNVSKVAVYLAKKLGLTEPEIELLELAGLLHDLGKLRVADSILEKSGPLLTDDIKVMRRHSFDSEMILNKIDGFKEVALLASLHHESLDGTGYPYQKTAEDLGMDARILILSDIFQALVQNRPYRKQLNPKKIIEILDEMRDSNKIDINILKIIKDNMDEVYSLANQNRYEYRIEDEEI